MEFKPFTKIPRLSRKMFITEKIDGTNAIISISDDGKEIRAGSRTRWIDVGSDNYGFALWVEQNKEELLTLGPGYHYGEWWGVGIQRGYQLHERRFSLFNVGRWNNNDKPSCCHVVPLLYEGDFDTTKAEIHLAMLKETGSLAAPGYMNPEGVVIYHEAGRCLFKKTIEADEKGKEQ